MNHKNSRLCLTARRASLAGALLAALCAATPAAGHRPCAPAVPAPSAAPATADSESCDLSPLKRMSGVDYSDRADAPAAFSKDFSLPTRRLVQAHATGREAQDYIRTLQKETEDNARYSYVSGIHEENRRICIYAHAADGAYDEILIFGLSDEECSALQLAGRFTTDNVLAVVRLLGR